MSGTKLTSICDEAGPFSQCALLIWFPHGEGQVLTA